MLIGLGAFACRDDARHAPSLVGGLDGGPVAALDGGLEHQPDGARGDAGRGPLTPATACAPVAQVLPVTAPAYHRTGKIDYPDPPPVGGDHNPCWGKWGVYDASSPLAVEHWVHNLEHGGVVYLYNCADGCADEVAQMASFVDGRTQAILTPYAALPTRFAVVAWGVRITSDCFDKTSFERFYSEHVNHGSEQISSDPPSSCL
ncbi:MAG: putative rane protein [Myxococcaceae bacterium]|nr:putative rane protein [Myxococcaceae bacterium]